eukprot:16200783-Heterocapsa_arctica.AAC.1
MSTSVPTLVAVAAKVSRPSLKCLVWRAITRAFTFLFAFLRCKSQRQSTTIVPGIFSFNSSSF